MEMLTKGKRIVVRVINPGSCTKLEVGVQNGGPVAKMGTIYPKGADGVVAFLEILRRTAEAEGMEFSYEEWEE